MKLFYLLLLSSFLSYSGYSQNASTYLFSTSTTTYSYLSGGTSVTNILGDDLLGSYTSIGFNFNFCGSTYNAFKPNSNGWLSFANVTPSSSQSRNNNTTNAQYIDPVVMPLWDDLSGSGGSAMYRVTGTAPNRIFTFEWRNWRWLYYASSGCISFQVKLYETTNVVEFIYKQESGTLQGPSATIGIARLNSDYKTLSNSSSSPTASSSSFYTSINSKPANGQIYRFSPPVVCSGMPTAGSISASASTICGTGSTTLNLAGASFGSGITYQWQYYNGSSWVNVGTNATSYTTANLTSTTQFR